MENVISREAARAAGATHYFTGIPCKRGHIAKRFVLNTSCLECVREAQSRDRDKINARDAERRAADPEKARAKWRADYWRDPERSRATSKRHHERNKEKRLADAREWKRRNADKVRAAKQAWRAANPERERATIRAYRAANRAAIKAKRKASYDANAERDRAIARAWHAANLDHARAAHRAWKKANPAAHVAHEAKRRARKLAAGGEFTAADVHRIGEAQRWRCHWCGTSIRHGYHVDHIMPFALGGSNEPRNLCLACKSCNQRKHARHPIEWARENGRLL